MHANRQLASSCRTRWTRCAATILSGLLAASVPLTAQALGSRPPPRQAGQLPIALADVVGRDLHYFGLGFLGHLAIWTGESVIEVLNDKTVVQENSLDSFRARDRFWGTVYYPGISTMQTGWTACRNAPDCVAVDSAPGAAFAIVRRAQHAKVIGAVYTLSTAYRPFAYGECRPGGRCIAAQRGVYRSDAFVRDMFMSTSDAWVAANGGSAAQRPINLPNVSVPRDLYFYLSERF